MADSASTNPLAQLHVLNRKRSQLKPKKKEHTLCTVCQTVTMYMCEHMHKTLMVLLGISHLRCLWKQTSWATGHGRQEEMALAI